MNPFSRMLAGSVLILGLVSGALAQPPAGRAPEASAARPAARLVFADYRYAFQGDARRGARFVRLGSGASALTHHPWESDGPWLSGERPQWHKIQLQLIQGAGIDVALVEFGGGPAERESWSIRGLDALVQALKEMRSSTSLQAQKAREYPLIGLSLDLTSLARQYGKPVDLRDGDVQRSLYGMIREFYMRLPAPFRATVPTGSGRGEAGEGCLVRLAGAAAVAAADGSFLSACGERFRSEFGQGLAWVGSPELGARVPGLRAWAVHAASASPARIERGGAVAAASLGPGFENALVAGDGSARVRLNGSAYIGDWRATMEARPEWIFLDSWNDFARGSELAPSLEYGLLYRDLTRGATLQFKETPEGLQYAGTILKAGMPAKLAPGTIAAVDVLVRNDGSADWGPFTQVSLTYRWLRDGKPAGDTGPAILLSQSRGDTRSYTVGVTGPTRMGKPAGEGDYDLEFGLVRRVGSEETWLEAASQFPVHLGVTVGEPAGPRPAWLASDMPSAAKSGAVYRATLNLRNDGPRAWSPESGAALVSRWRRVSTYLKGYSEDADVLLGEGPRVPLVEAVPPGRSTLVPATVAVQDAGGKALPPWTPTERWSYVLEWDLWDGKQFASAAGGQTLREVIEVVDRDPAPGFIGCNLPAELVAGRTEKVTLGLRNLGPETWKAQRDRIVAHWYYLDGTEAAWADSSYPLPEDVPPYSEVAVRSTAPAAPAAGRKPKPGSPVVEREATVVRDFILRDVPVHVPQYFGPMYVVFDLIHDGQPASTAPGPKGTDLLVVPVNVYGPTYLPLPLTAFFDTDGISSDLNRADGNVDGRGNSLPAEQLPPYVTRPATGSGPSASPIYPCGLWVRALSDAAADRVTFLYPGKADRAPNMIACSGQRIPLVGGPRKAVHLLAIGTTDHAAGDFRLIYADASTETRRLQVSHFSDPPHFGEHAAFVAAHRHTPRGDDLTTRCYINHYVLPADVKQPLVALDLPDEPGIKIIALTLESPPQSPGVAGGP